VKYSFNIRYTLDMPLAIAVAVYLDCEHYLNIHSAYISNTRITEAGRSHYRAGFYWNVLGFTWGQSQKAEYRAPGTFINSELEPLPRWLPSIHHFIKTRTTLNYFETSDGKTLSDLVVDLEMPPLVYPFRHIIRAKIEKIKILKDLEDVAMAERRALLFGRSNNSAYLAPRQFLLFKDQYTKYFGEDSVYRGDRREIERDEDWPDIKALDFPYVKDFLEKKYPRYATYTHGEIVERLERAKHRKELHVVSK
jgi:hypothetical protein